MGRPAQIRTGTQCRKRRITGQVTNEKRPSRLGSAGNLVKTTKGENKRQQHSSCASQWSSGRASETVCVCRLSPERVGYDLRGERRSGHALRAVNFQLHGPSGLTLSQQLGRVAQDRAVPQARACWRNWDPVVWQRSVCADNTGQRGNVQEFDGVFSP